MVVSQHAVPQTTLRLHHELISSMMQHLVVIIAALQMNVDYACERSAW